ncbi:hypothetical protein [Bacterioplanoides sp.]|uniref:hypothetical protein n=1 Tax=Bacterioplanoides sp. TaxID=2066072 RepID=UPI003B5BDFF8
MCSDPDYAEQNEYEKALIEQSESMWADYQENYVPLENQVIKEVEGKRSAGYQQYSKDQAVNAARMQTPGTVTVGAGMQPGSGSFARASQSAQQQSGAAGAMGAMAGLQSAEDQYMSGMMGLAQTGRGQQASAMSGYSSLAANQAGTDMAELMAKQQVSSARWGAVGSMAGMGASAYMKQSGLTGNNNTSSGTATGT